MIDDHRAAMPRCASEPKVGLEHLPDDLVLAALVLQQALKSLAFMALNRRAG